MAITFEDVKKIFERIDNSGGLNDAMKSDLEELRDNFKSISDERDTNADYKKKYEDSVTSQSSLSDEVTQWKEKYNDLSNKYRERYSEDTPNVNKDLPQDEYALHSRNNPTSIEELFS